MTHFDFLQMVSAHLLRRPGFFAQHYPKPLLSLVADAMNKIVWWPTIDRDMIERCYIDDKSELDFRRALRSAKTPMEKKTLGGWESWERCGFEQDQLDFIEDRASIYLRTKRPP